MHNKRPTRLNTTCKAVFDPRHFDNRGFWFAMEKFQGGLYLTIVERKLQATQCMNTYNKTISGDQTYAICYPGVEEWIFSVRQLAIPGMKDVLLNHAHNANLKQEIEHYYLQSYNPTPFWLRSASMPADTRQLPVWGYTLDEKPFVDLDSIKEPTPKADYSNLKFYLGLFLMLSGIALIAAAFLFTQVLSGHILGMSLVATGLICTMSGICFFKRNLSKTTKEADLEIDANLNFEF